MTRSSLSWFVVLVLAFVASLVLPDAPAFARHVPQIVEAPTDLPAGTPVRVTNVPDLKGTFGVFLSKGARSESVPLQADPIVPEGTGWFQLPFAVAKGEKLEWSLALEVEPISPEKPETFDPLALPEPRFETAHDHLDLFVRYGSREILRYAVAERKSDEPDKDYLTRSGYFHPVKTLAGDVVTDDFSPDHAHQHGIFFAWTESRFGDTKTEFWNQHLRRGTIRHAGLGPSGGGAVLAGFETKQVYRLPESDEPILEETWQARCFALDAQTWLLDLTVKQTALNEAPFVNQKYHYGGLGLRGARHWTPDVASFLTSERKDRLAGNATRPLWSALSGPVESRKPTLAVLDCPSNFRYPTPVRLHPSMPYFAIAPMIEGEFEISKERPFVARYGVVVTSDAVAPERLDSLQAAFAADLTVRSGDHR